MDRVLVTGASGFVGSALIKSLKNSGRYRVMASMRSAHADNFCNTDLYVIDNLGPETIWVKALYQCNTVVHCAARVHLLEDEDTDPLTEYRKVNVEGTLNLARQAAEAGVNRFIFISSIVVNGHTNTRPFEAEDVPFPTDPFAQSKWEAEQGLWRIQQDYAMQVVIIRPPLVYGANAAGNFGKVVQRVARGMPLPLGAIHNQRSLLALDNLIDLIITCIEHPKAGNQVFLAGDGCDMSTSELLRRVGEAMGITTRLIPVPTSLLMAGASLIGKKKVAKRLLGSLQVDISKAQDILGWQPPLTVEQGLRRCFESGNFDSRSEA